MTSIIYICDYVYIYIQYIAIKMKNYIEISDVVRNDNTSSISWTHKLCYKLKCDANESYAMLSVPISGCRSCSNTVQEGCCSSALLLLMSGDAPSMLKVIHYNGILLSSVEVIPSPRAISSGLPHLITTTVEHHNQANCYCTFAVDVICLQKYDAIKSQLTDIMTDALVYITRNVDSDVVVEDKLYVQKVLYYSVEMLNLPDITTMNNLFQQVGIVGTYEHQQLKTELYPLYKQILELSNNIYNKNQRETQRTTTKLTLVSKILTTAMHLVMDMMDKLERLEGAPSSLKRMIALRLEELNRFQVVSANNFVYLSWFS